MSQKTSTHHEQRFLISGVCCSTEQAVLCKTLDRELGRGSYEFDLLTQELVVAGHHSSERICESVRDAGFQARLWSAHVSVEPFWTKHAEAVRITAAVLLAFAGVFSGEGILHHGLLFWSIVVAGWKAFPKAWKALRARSLDMNVLMAGAVIGAIGIDKWTEASAVMILYAVSLMLESYSLSRSRSAIQSLMKMAPEEATILREGKELRVRAENVQPGELSLVKPGERIPFDGTILSGSTSVDQSVITGESLPVSRGPGESVFAGSLNGRGAITLEVTRAYRDTTIARIMHMVEDAQKTRAPIQGLVERFARIYTPAVFAAAFFVAVIPPLIGHESPSAWLYRALVLLVIACPCALVISTPITLVSAMTNAARKGILIKGGKYIEALGHVGAIAFDKTGTLTEGIPSVTDVVSLNSLAEDEILAIVAAIESHSEHHLAGAVISAARQRDITFRRNAVDHFESVPGKGIRATLGGVPYAVGNHQFCHEEEYCSPEVEHVLNRLQQKGKTTMVLGSMKKPLGIIGIMDTARRQADGAILNLRNLGIRHLSMLSGDHDQTARATALPLGLDAYEGGLLPGQKVERVQQLKEKFGTVAMVGDGVNDAPAFAASSVGIAMGVRGSDTALETADVVLMSDNLSGLSHTVALCRRTLAVVRQNIAIALGLKLLFLILSIGGVATLWMAVLADDGAALIVILNGLRMLSYTSEQ